MAAKDAPEVEQAPGENNRPKEVIEDLNSQLRCVKTELEGTKKRLKKAEYERDNAEIYVTNLKKEVATLSKELHEERKRRKEESKNRHVNSVCTSAGVENPEATRNQNDNHSSQDESKDLKSVLKEAASEAMTKSGFVYDDRTGLYYDWNSGLYYDPNSCLYYNNKTGTYYYYNEASSSYQFHSQVDLPNETNKDKNNEEEKRTEAKEKNKKRSKQTEKTRDVEKEYSSGEVTDSEDSEDDQATTDEDTPCIQPVAPCIRAIVSKSNRLKIGTLFIVPCTGGTLGREKSIGHLIRIPDLEISKHHCRLKYDEERRQYFICDLASRNGSFLNGERLGQSKEQSEAHVITHGDTLTVGGTTLKLHIHPGNETCYDCEPGQVQAQEAAVDSDEVCITKVVQPASLTAEDLRKKQLKKLKKAYGLEKEAFCDGKEVMNKGKYRDRADLRRVKVGSDLPIEIPDAPPASVHKPINSENKGRKMLEKMGWKEGEGLGREGVGRKEPVIVNVHENKRGLGSGLKRTLDDTGMPSRSASYIRAKTRERYDKISSSTVSLPSGQGVLLMTQDNPSTGRADISATSTDEAVDMFVE